MIDHMQLELVFPSPSHLPKTSLNLNDLMNLEPLDEWNYNNLYFLTTYFTLHNVLWV